MTTSAGWRATFASAGGENSGDAFHDRGAGMPAWEASFSGVDATTTASGEKKDPFDAFAAWPSEGEELGDEEDQEDQQAKARANERYKRKSIMEGLQSFQIPGENSSFVSEEVSEVSEQSRSVHNDADDQQQPRQKSEAEAQGDSNKLNHLKKASVQSVKNVRHNKRLPRNEKSLDNLLQAPSNHDESVDTVPFQNTLSARRANKPSLQKGLASTLGISKQLSNSLRPLRQSTSLPQVSPASDPLPSSRQQHRHMSEPLPANKPHRRHSLEKIVRFQMEDNKVVLAGQQSVTSSSDPSVFDKLGTETQQQQGNASEKPTKQQGAAARQRGHQKHHPHQEHQSEHHNTLSEEEGARKTYDERKQPMKAKRKDPLGASDHRHYHHHHHHHHRNRKDHLAVSDHSHNRHPKRRDELGSSSDHHHQRSRRRDPMAASEQHHHERRRANKTANRNHKQHHKNATSMSDLKYNFHEENEHPINSARNGGDLPKSLADISIDTTADALLSSSDGSSLHPQLQAMQQNKKENSLRRRRTSHKESPKDTTNNRAKRDLKEEPPELFQQSMMGLVSIDTTDPSKRKAPPPQPEPSRKSSPVRKHSRSDPEKHRTRHEQRPQKTDRRKLLRKNSSLSQFEEVIAKRKGRRKDSDGNQASQKEKKRMHQSLREMTPDDSEELDRGDSGGFAFRASFHHDEDSKQNATQQAATNIKRNVDNESLSLADVQDEADISQHPELMPYDDVGIDEADVDNTPGRSTLRNSGGVDSLRQPIESPNNAADNDEGNHIPTRIERGGVEIKAQESLKRNSSFTDVKHGRHERTQSSGRNNPKANDRLKTHMSLHKSMHNLGESSNKEKLMGSSSLRDHSEQMLGASLRIEDLENPETTNGRMADEARGKSWNRKSRSDHEKRRASGKENPGGLRRAASSDHHPKAKGKTASSEANRRTSHSDRLNNHQKVRSEHEDTRTSDMYDTSETSEKHRDPVQRTKHTQRRRSSLKHSSESQAGKSGQRRRDSMTDSSLPEKAGRRGRSTSRARKPSSRTAQNDVGHPSVELPAGSGHHETGKTMVRRGSLRKQEGSRGEKTNGEELGYSAGSHQRRKLKTTSKVVPSDNTDTTMATTATLRPSLDLSQGVQASPSTRGRRQLLRKNSSLTDLEANEKDSDKATSRSRSKTSKMHKSISHIAVDVEDESNRLRRGRSKSQRGKHRARSTSRKPESTRGVPMVEHRELEKVTVESKPKRGRSRSQSKRTNRSDTIQKSDRGRSSSRKREDADYKKEAAISQSAHETAVSTGRHRATITSTNSKFLSHHQLSQDDEEGSLGSLDLLASRKIESQVSKDRMHRSMGILEGRQKRRDSSTSRYSAALEGDDYSDKRPLLLRINSGISALSFPPTDRRKKKKTDAEKNGEVPEPSPIPTSIAFVSNYVADSDKSNSTRKRWHFNDQAFDNSSHRAMRQMYASFDSLELEPGDKQASEDPLHKSMGNLDAYLVPSPQYREIKETFLAANVKAKAQATADVRSGEPEDLTEDDKPVPRWKRRQSTHLLLADFSTDKAREHPRQRHGAAEDKRIRKNSRKLFLELTEQKKQQEPTEKFWNVLSKAFQPLDDDS